MRRVAKKVGWLVVFSLLLYIVFSRWGGTLSPFFVKVLAPVSRLVTEARYNILLGLKLFEPELTLVAQNESLKKRNAELQRMLADREFIALENELLRERLGIETQGFITASILLLPPQTPFDTLLADRGSESGIASGAKVLGSERVALGFVEEVQNGFSRVVMYSSPRLKTAAVLERDGTMVELEGRGGGDFFLEAPLDFDVIEGDTFVLTGSERLVVAVARSIKREETSSFISILLEVPIDINGNSPLLIEI